MAPDGLSFTIHNNGNFKRSALKWHNIRKIAAGQAIREIKTSILGLKGRSPHVPVRFLKPHKLQATLQFESEHCISIYFHST
jgi:hypothetical protein